MIMTNQIDAGALATRIREALSRPITSDDVIEPDKVLEDVLRTVGLDLHSAGGSIDFVGKDPILKSPWPLATMAGVALMAKAVGVADLWRYRTGRSQSLSIDLRKAPHRLCPFYDKKWELLNGHPPQSPSDPTNAFSPSHMYPTRDGRWIQLLNIYPKAKTRELAFLGCADNPGAISEVTRRWNSFELEEKANAAGLQATVIRNTEEFLGLEQFEYLARLPLVRITKIGDCPPVGLTQNPRTPLDGVRAIGLGHVIAGAGLGRAMAYHGADVLNVWQPLDFEIDQMYFTSSVGMRSSILDLKRPDSAAKLKDLIAEADIFFANRRPGYLNQFQLTAEDLAQLRPGMIHVSMSLYGPTGPWSGRTGFDQNAGGVSGVLATEGSFENPALPEIFVVNDYAMAWISCMAVTATLRRRAVEGGSYRIEISLARLSAWLLQLGHFNKAYARAVGCTEGDHAYLSPELFEADTPCGHYQGVTDQVEMSDTPGFYRTPLVARGSCQPVWLERTA
jgi:crotonobetainyl-CoA:carnitine CoA-transferase CaiB-like acyl-CoA transferase